MFTSERSFRILTAVLKFLNAPLHHSRWLIAAVAAWIGVSGFVFVIASVVMMLDLGGELIGTAFVVAVGISGFWMIKGWLPK
jgi:hypothetical protein